MNDLARRDRTMSIITMQRRTRITRTGRTVPAGWAIMEGDKIVASFTTRRAMLQAYGPTLDRLQGARRKAWEDQTAALWRLDARA